MREYSQPERRSAQVQATRWGKTLQWLKHLGAGVGIAALLAPADALPAQPVQASQPPQHWISYAQLASNQFAAWLSDPANDAVVRLHGWMQERLLKEGQPLPPPLVTRVWVAPSGKVERLEFASLGNAQADHDLRTLLTAQPLSEPPPPDMRQPMVLQLTLDFPQKQ